MHCQGSEVPNSLDHPEVIPQSQARQARFSAHPLPSASGFTHAFFVPNNAGKVQMYRTEDNGDTWEKRGITAAEQKLNATDFATAERAIRELPAMLDHIDQLLADGVIGGDEPNAADLQIAPTVRLLLTVGDLRPLIEGRPLAAWARSVAPEAPGAVPPGVYAVTA